MRPAGREQGWLARYTETAASWNRLLTRQPWRGFHTLPVTSDCQADMQGSLTESLGIVEPLSMSELQPCELCGRVLKRGTTAHHLIPRTCHRNKWFQKNFSRQQMRQTVELCHDCHSAVHRLVPREKELGREFNTLDKLRGHPAISKCLAWVRHQK